MKPETGTDTNYGEADPLMQVLREAAVADAVFENRRTQLLLGELAHNVMATAQTTDARRKRTTARSPRRLGTVAAVLAILFLSAFVYNTFTARTGLFGNPKFTEEDRTEWIRTDASDYRTVVEELRPELPLPTGVTWTPMIERMVTNGQEEPSLQQETVIRATFAFYAQCRWLNAWAEAYRHGDTGAMQGAQQVLAEAADWPEIVEVDGGGVRSALWDIAQAASQGNLDALEFPLAECRSFPMEAGHER